MARFNAVDVVLWALRIGVVLVVVVGTVSTLIKNRYDAAQWFDFVMFGLTIGSIYAQIALGYTMVYGVLRLINFAHGDIVMTGAFAGYFIATPLDRSGFLESQPVLAMAAILLVAVTVSTSIAVLTERIAYRPFRRVVGLAPLICAIGVSFFLEQTFRGMFGSAVKYYPEAQWERVDFQVFGFHVAGIAGVFYAFVYKQVYFLMGFTPCIKAFGAAVLGGIGNIPGAMLGGFFLGMVESVGPTLFLDGLGIPAPYQLRDLIAFTLLIMVLIFRPQGLLGERMARRRA